MRFYEVTVTTFFLKNGIKRNKFIPLYNAAINIKTLDRASTRQDPERLTNLNEQINKTKNVYLWQTFHH